jgi:hypothetical protein
MLADTWACAWLLDVSERHRILKAEEQLFPLDTISRCLHAEGIHAFVYDQFFSLH